MPPKTALPDSIVIPLQQRVLICKDDARPVTKGGIILPDDSKIPTITGRVVAISPDLEDDTDFPVRKYDKVLLNPTRSIPVDLEQGNKLYIIPAADVIAVFRTNDD